MPNRSALPLSLSEGVGIPPPRMAGGLPLTGLTLLAVEDSRYACEALRLLAGRSGARLRRAETLALARRHMQIYLPDVVLVDLGLPDGSGADLIAELAQDARFEGLLLAMSGDPDNRNRALAAGAAEFLEKPFQSLAAFQQTVLRHLPLAGRHAQTDTGQRIAPDTQALRDDLAHAATLVADTRTDTRRYVASFVRGLARASQDDALETAARQADDGGAAGMCHLARALNDRLAVQRTPFG